MVETCQAVASQCVNVGRWLILILRIICGVASCTARVACLKATVADDVPCASAALAGTIAKAQTCKPRKKMQEKKWRKCQQCTKGKKPLQGLSAVRPRSLLNDTSTMLGGKFDTLLERRDETSFLCCICFTRLCCWHLHRLGVCSHIYHCWPQ